MELKIFSIYDSKAAAYLTPFFLPRTEMAIRAFVGCLKESDHQFAKHPEDFTLFQVGSFDPNTAKFTDLKESVTVITGLAAQKPLHRTPFPTEAEVKGSIDPIDKND